MRYQVIFAVNFALLLAAVAAQLNIPSCALNCLTSSSFGTCSHTDTNCLCETTNAVTFQSDLEKCGVKNCGTADLISVGNFCANQIDSMIATEEASDSAVNAEDSSTNAGAYASTTPAGITPAAATGTGTPATGTGAPVLVPSPTSTAPANAAVGRGTGAVGALFAPFIASAVLGSIIF